MLPAVVRAVSQETSLTRPCEVSAQPTSTVAAALTLAKVWMDGGVRSGQDVFKAIAYGAKGVVCAAADNDDTDDGHYDDDD